MLTSCQKLCCSKYLQDEELMNMWCWNIPVHSCEHARFQTDVSENSAVLVCSFLQGGRAGRVSFSCDTWPVYQLSQSLNQCFIFLISKMNINNECGICASRCVSMCLSIYLPTSLFIYLPTYLSTNHLEQCLAWCSQCYLSRNYCYYILVTYNLLVLNKILRRSAIWLNCGLSCENKMDF